MKQPTPETASASTTKINSLQQEAIALDFHIEEMINCDDLDDLVGIINKYYFRNKRPTDYSDLEQKIQEKAAKYNKSREISSIEIILAFILYFAFSVAFSQSITAWAAATLGVSVALATILLTASVLVVFRVGVEKSFLVTTLQEKYRWFMSLDSANKIEYSLYAAVYLGFLIIPFLPIGGAFFSTILSYASTLFEIGITPTGIILMIVWALIPITIKNGVAVNNSAKEENKTINSEIFSKNPVHRVRQAYFHLFHSLYLRGMKNPISMLAFSVVFFGIMADMCYSFLPTFLHHALIMLAHGVTNAALGPLVSGFMLGWFLGLITLVICEAIARDKSNTSDILLYCASLRDNLLDAILFTIVLIIGAHLMSGSAIAYICGHWEIIGLITINIKPILGIYDFVTDPVSSVIGTCTILVPLMPFIIIMHPELCIKYLLDFIITTIMISIRYVLCVFLVWITALLDLTALANKKLSNYIPKIPDATEEIKSKREALFNIFQVINALIKNLYNEYDVLAKPATAAGIILNFAYILMSAAIIVSAINIMIPGLTVPAILLSWGMWPVNILASFFGMNAAPLIAAMAGAYMLSLSLCNIFIPLDNRKTNTYLKDNLFIALLFFAICPLLAVHTQAIIITTYSAFTAHSFSLLATLCSLLPCYILNNIKKYEDNNEPPIVFDIYKGLNTQSADFAKNVDNVTKPLQSYANKAYKHLVLIAENYKDRLLGAPVSSK